MCFIFVSHVINHVTRLGLTRRRNIFDGRRYLINIFHVDGIPIQSHGEGYALLIKTKELESKMLAYRLYRGHDISTVCTCFVYYVPVEIICVTRCS